MNNQLSLFSLRDLEEKLEYDFENYDWLKGDPDSLKIYFREELRKKDLKPHLRKDCIRRLKELEKMKIDYSPYERRR